MLFLFLYSSKSLIALSGETVIKAVYQSLRVSHFYPGHKIDKFKGVWLQHVNKSHLIRNCGKNKYIKYLLVRIKRNEQEYTRTKWHHTTLHDFFSDEVITVYERDGKIFTDGYGEQKALIPAIAQLYETCNRAL